MRWLDSGGSMAGDDEIYKEISKCTKRCVEAESRVLREDSRNARIDVTRVARDGC